MEVFQQPQYYMASLDIVTATLLEIQKAENQW